MNAFLFGFIHRMHTRREWAHKKESPAPDGRAQDSWLNLKKNGGDLLSHCHAVPSARTGLTALFGMGRGGTPAL